MTIVQLEYLLAVVNHGSFSAAARHCFISQSALSKQIASLEEELDVVILNRNSKPIVPTEAGKSVIEQVKLALSAFYGTKEVVDNLKGAEGRFAGNLKIAVIPTISPYLIPRFVVRFTKRYPNVKLEIMDMYTMDIVDALNRDLVDAAILSGGQSEVKIEETDLFDDTLYMYVSRENELYGRKNITTDDIDVKKLLILSKGNCLRNQTLKLCRERGKVELQYDFLQCSLDTLMNTADSTGATTIVPGMAIGYIPQEKRDQIIPFGRNGARRKISIAVGRTCVKHTLIEAVKKTIMEVREELQVVEFLIDR